MTSTLVTDLLMMTALKGALIPPTYTLRLFTAGPTISKRMTKAMFTEATFNGYVGQNGLGWSANYVDQNGEASADGIDWLFPCTGNAIQERILGWYITNDPGSDVLFAEKFDTPFNIGQIGDAVTVGVDLKINVAPE